MLIVSAADRRAHQWRRVRNRACRSAVDVDRPYAVSPVQMTIVRSIQDGDADRVAASLEPERTDDQRQDVTTWLQSK